MELISRQESFITRLECIATLWEKIAAEETSATPSDLKTLKMLYSLAGHEMANHRNAMLKMTITCRSITKNQSVSSSTAEAFELLMNDNYAKNNANNGNKDAHQVWHKAAACHFLMLCHQQMYNKNPESAMKTAIKCTEFVDVLGTEQVYSIVALAAFQSKKLLAIMYDTSFSVFTIYCKLELL